MLRALILALGLVAGSEACAEGDTAEAGQRSIAGHIDVASLQLQTSDSAVIAAQAALAQGRPWRATRLLAPVLADSTRRTPEAMLLAATAASEWEGWDEARAILEGAPWLDTLAAGLGRELLARAALERRADDEAATHARAALASARAPQDRAVRLVLLARALDRLDQRDSAKAAYARAATLMPPVGDWLRLRAAGVEPELSEREDYYGDVRTPVARDRLRWTEAAALERAREFSGAARLYDSLGVPATALRLRLVDATDSVAKAAIRRELVSLVARRAGTDDARTAIELLDKDFAPLTPAEELIVARGASVSGPLARAADAFGRALQRGGGTAEDRYAYANVLSRLGRDADAAREFALVKAPSPLAGRAAYFRVRALLRADRRTNVAAALRQVVSAFGSDTAAASLALFLQGDLAEDDARDAEARRLYLELARGYPTADQAPLARFRAAMIAFTAGDVRAAAAEMDSLRTRGGGERLAATYWAGRALDRAGDTVAAHARWRELSTREPLSYYGWLSAKRLGEPAWTPPPASDSVPQVPSADSAFARADLLERLGMDVEARFEYDRLTTDASASPERMLATARAFVARGLTSRAIPIGNRLLERGMQRDERTYRVIYPVVLPDVLASESARHALDPALVGALIRQESNFNPRARSPVGALGLMQIMPPVGRQIARSLKYPNWEAVLLYQPDVNMELGTIHLANATRQYDDLARALAAYNAGGSRVARWRTKRGAEDPEVFVERIPYAETRDYVRIVLRTRELYRSLYGW